MRDSRGGRQVGRQALLRGLVRGALGQPTSTGYPDDLGLGTDPARTVSFTYTNGFLTAVPSFAGSISYHPNTMVNQVVRANGVTDTYRESSSLPTSSTTSTRPMAIRPRTA